jgi:N6-adenosine-specific RNA methylase IME4
MTAPDSPLSRVPAALAGAPGCISESHQNIPAKPLTFSCIVADPPWAYRTQTMRGGLGYSRPATGAPMTHAELEYPTMSVEEIAALPVPGLARDDSHLYLWTTQTFLRDSYRVLDAWGFKQGALLVWSKPPKGVCGTYVCSVEFCIFARRGHLHHKRRQIGTCFEWPRGGHSAKPEAFLDMVESVSPGPYLELFARCNRLGWSTWGNEAICHVHL